MQAKTGEQLRAARVGEKRTKIPRRVDGENAEGHEDIINISAEDAGDEDDPDVT